MLDAFAAARLWLANLDPAAPAVALMLGVFLTIYSIRRWFPRAWIWVEKTVPFVDSLDYRPAATILWKAWQAWPAALLGAGATALSTGGSVSGALKGAALGAAVAVIHELAAAYKGKLSTPKPKAPSSGPMFGVVAAFILTLVLSCGLPGCSLFGPGGSVWPKIGTCAPTGETLFSEVASVLTSSGGSYEDDLLALGKSEGMALVECAVKAVVDALSARMHTPGARITPDEGLGVARGKAFLAKIEEAHK